MTARVRKPGYRARRLAQTPRAFTNWPAVLRDMALGRAGRGPDSLTFRTRTGARIDTPNRPGARVPVYEIFADDSYRFEWFLGPLLHRPIRVFDIGGHGRAVFRPPHPPHPPAPPPPLQAPAAAAP